MMMHAQSTGVSNSRLLLSLVVLSSLLLLKLLMGACPPSTRLRLLVFATMA